MRPELRGGGDEIAFMLESKVLLAVGKQNGRFRPADVLVREPGVDVRARTGDAVAPDKVPPCTFTRPEVTAGGGVTEQGPDRMDELVDANVHGESSARSAALHREGCARVLRTGKPCDGAVRGSCWQIRRPWRR